eukprot:6488186-Amphidinium_carterae.1
MSVKTKPACTHTMLVTNVGQLSRVGAVVYLSGQFVCETHPVKEPFSILISITSPLHLTASACLVTGGSTEEHCENAQKTAARARAGVTRAYTDRRLEAK